MKKILTVIIIGVLCLSMFSMLARFLPPAGAAATIGEALSFDGTNDYVYVPPINADVYTIALWFKPTTNFALIGSNRFLIQTADQSLIVWHNVYVGPRSWSAAIGTGAWHHLTVIIDYTSWQITPYLDGVSLGMKDMTTTTKPDITWMTIGAYGGDRFFNGAIDEVKFYNRTLSAGEISYDYNSGIGVYGRPATGLVGLWHFDADAKDYSGYGRNGTVYGAISVEGKVPLPDVTISEVTATPTKVLSGDSVDVQVKAKNTGAGAYENFSVSAYYDDNSLIGTKQVTGLIINAETTLTFSWSTVGVSLDHHGIKANATIVQGETNTTNNEMIDDNVWIVKPPVGRFTYSPVPAIENLTTTFNASSSTPEGGWITWYNWDFGDAHTQNVTTLTTTHVYSEHGSYNVTLTVGDSEGLTNNVSTSVEVLRNDVAVIDVTPYRNWVYVSLPLNLNVTVANFGNFTETATVDLYYNMTSGGKIGTETCSLSPNDPKTLTFTWNTDGIEPGLNYTITAKATIPFDSNVTNNVLEARKRVYVKGTALGFDGIDDYVLVPPVDSRAYTFELWFNASKNSVLIGSDRFRIQTSGNALTVWYDVNKPPVTWSVPITTGTWHHLIVIIDYRNWRIAPYLDGAALGAQYGSTQTRPAIAWIKIGSDGQNAFFEGSIDELRIYNTNLNLSTVQAHYNNGLGCYGRPEHGLISGYHFDEGIGIIAGDYSGNGNNATIYGAKWVEGHVKLPNSKLSDVNSDGKVNVLDLILVARAVGTKPGNPLYDPCADINTDGKINVLDLVLVATHLGT